MVPNVNSSSTFPKEGGIFVLISFDGKCHGVGAWWVLLICMTNFNCNEDIMSNRLYLDTGDS